jgi:cytochrome c5
MQRSGLAIGVVIVAAAVAGGLLLVLESGGDEGARAPEVEAPASPSPADRLVEANRLPRRVRPGALVFLEAGCEHCHTYAGEGTPNVDARDLTAVGAGQGKDAAYFRRYVTRPREFGNRVMPSFAALGQTDLQALVEFLAASKGSG